MAVMGIGAANWLKGSGALLLSCRTNSIPAVVSSCTVIASRSRVHYCSSTFSLQHQKKNNTLFSSGVNGHKIGDWGSQVTKLYFNFYCTASSNVSIEEKDSSGEVVEEDEESKMRKIKDAANSLDIRVGRIIKAWRHEEADSLYVEEVDVGEAEPRIICSGLVKYVPLDHLQERSVIVLANLKPRNMRGVKSNGMLMAASDASHENVELLEPPEGAVPGERIWFGSADEKDNLPDVATPNQVAKKKIWELVQPHLKTDGASVAALGTHCMRASTGVVAIKSKNVGYTHFVSLPLTLPDEMVTKLNNFKNWLLQTNKECMKDRGTREKAYVVHAPLEVIGGIPRLIRACRIHNFWHLLPSL